MSERSNEYLERMLKTLEVELDMKDMELEELHERVMELELSTEEESPVEEESSLSYLKEECTTLKRQLRVKDIEVKSLQHTLQKNQSNSRFCHELLNEFRTSFYYPAKLAHETAVCR